METKAEVALTDIIAKNNPRSDLPEIDKLATSIKKVGVLQPVVVHHDVDGKLHLVAGFRRYYAARKAGLLTIPVILKEDVTEKKRLQIALIENIQRENMNPMDTALALKGVLELVGSQKAVAEELGVSEGYVSQYLGMLNLPSAAQRALATGDIDLTKARHLSKVKEESLLLELLTEAKDISASELGMKVDTILHEKKVTKLPAQPTPDDEEKPPKKASKGGAPKLPPDEDILPMEAEKTTLAEIYMQAKLHPKPEKDLRDLLCGYAIKLERAESAEKKKEYQNVLKGLELAAGVKKS